VDPVIEEEETDQAMNYCCMSLIPCLILLRQLHVDLGEKKPIFKYSFVGSHGCESGFSCLLPASCIADLKSISWDQFKKELNNAEMLQQR
jgi:hypothetical protein